jgi:hypothetical protein
LDLVGGAAEMIPCKRVREGGSVLFNFFSNGERGGSSGYTMWVHTWLGEKNNLFLAETLFKLRFFGTS